MNLTLQFKPTFFERWHAYRSPGARPLPPDVKESPHQQRERLRKEVKGRGGAVKEVETITGDCPAQTAQQIRDLTAWLKNTPEAR